MVDVTAAFKEGLAASVADEVGSDLDFAWLCEALGTPEHFLLRIDCIAHATLSLPYPRATWVKKGAEWDKPIMHRR